MLLLVLFAFLGGVITVLSPCILPVLPIILSGAAGSGRLRPWGVIAGFVLSFTLLTLLLVSVVRTIPLAPETVRLVASGLIVLLGALLLFPALGHYGERLSAKMTGRVSIPGTEKKGLGGGLLTGVAAGMLWTPCIGPIMAAVMTLAITQQVSLAAVFITLTYALGTALPMLALVMGGRQLFTKNDWLRSNAVVLQRGVGLVLIVLAVVIGFGGDRRLQGWLLEKVPSYGTALTQIENTPAVRRALDDLEDKGVGATPGDFPYQTPPELAGIHTWLNSDERVVFGNLTGKVVLIDFWSYSCAYCIQSLPALRKWHETYLDQGLVIVGVHSPQYPALQSEAEVERVLESHGIDYPVALDSSLDSWRLYENRAWPARYFIDRTGQVRHFHLGGGGYRDQEKVIQALLEERD